MAKTKIIGLAIVLIMFISVLASAVFYQNPSQQNQQQDTLQIPQDGVFDKELESWEEDVLLSNGISVFEYSYSECSQECVQEIADLKSFVMQFGGPVVLSVYQSDSQTLKLKSADWTETLLENTTQEYLEDILCEKVPNNKICLLREI